LNYIDLFIFLYGICCNYWDQTLCFMVNHMSLLLKGLWVQC